jgi:type II secretory ATPase GspE/PulE/Tfp pilus assembly ATPase PilB-like protein
MNREELKKELGEAFREAADALRAISREAGASDEGVREPSTEREVAAVVAGVGVVEESQASVGTSGIGPELPVQAGLSEEQVEPLDVVSSRPAPAEISIPSGSRGEGPLGWRSSLMDRGWLRPGQEPLFEKKMQQQPGELQKVVSQLSLFKEEDWLPFVAGHLFLPYQATLEEADVQTTGRLKGAVSEELAKRWGVVPVSLREDTEGKGEILHLAVSDPLNTLAMDAVGAMLDRPIRWVVVPAEVIEQARERIYKKGEAELLAEQNPQATMESLLSEIATEEGGDVELLDQEDAPAEDALYTDLEDGGPVIKFVNLMVVQAVRRRASDIHVEPEERAVRVRYRIDGVLNEVQAPPKNVLPAIVSRIKVMADLDIAERRRPQDGRIRLRVDKGNIDIRISTLPGIHGEKVVMRLLNHASILVKLEDLGFDEDLMKIYEGIVGSPHGVFLVTGPTGSGKTTTLYATLSRLNVSGRNIVTVEDPVEYQLKGIHQTQVNVKAGVTFAGGLRSILRQDPDIIMIGEMRDLETAQIAMQAATTGHLVLSTLHTNDAPSSISRLIDLGVAPYVVSTSVVGILAQRLARKNCQACLEPYQPSRAVVDTLLSRVDGVEFEFMRGKGCEACEKSGYKGRTALLELMPVSEKIKAMVSSQKPTHELAQAAREDGMRTLWQHGFEQAALGITSPDEVVRVAGAGAEEVRDG